MVSGGIWADVLFGTLATLIGALGTYAMRGLRGKARLLSVLPPILANSVIVPFVLKYGYGAPLPIPVMMAICLSTGLLGVTSYTIRISATQSYIPDEKKGRYNGATNMIFTAGALVGEGTAGALSQVMPERLVLLAAMLLTAAAAVVVIGGQKQHVAPIYNRQE